MAGRSATCGNAAQARGRFSAQGRSNWRPFVAIEPRRVTDGGWLILHGRRSQRQQLSPRPALICFVRLFARTPINQNR